MRAYVVVIQLVLQTGYYTISFVMGMLVSVRLAALLRILCVLRFLQVIKPKRGEFVFLYTCVGVGYKDLIIKLMSFALVDFM